MRMTQSTAFKNLPFENRFVDSLKGDPETENRTRKVMDAFYSRVHPTSVSNPKLVGWSTRLATDLGISKPDANDSESLQILAGNRVLDSMKSFAARYGGHQFGHWAGQLGDGRAITLSEANTLAGKMEFQLKGAGPTPYSRRADGRAVLRSSLREFVCSEAMAFLGVPTTRALSLVLTGDAVTRDMFYDGNPQDEPGAVVCRVSPSFIRFGNFEILAAHQEVNRLRELVDYVLREFYPEILTAYSDHDQQVIELLKTVARKTAVMVTDWMRVGFVHGVMNTDNFSILGLTIDYGPYGWLEPFDLMWTPNTTDAEGKRYRFGAQPNIAFWNVARLADALSVLFEGADAKERHEQMQGALDEFKHTFAKVYSEMFSAKLGLKTITGREKWVEELFALMENSEVDYTLFFRMLSNELPDANLFSKLETVFYAKTTSPDKKLSWDRWIQNYAHYIAMDDEEANTRFARMKQVNPRFVFRNYLAQTAIQAAEKNDFSVLERILKAIEQPYSDDPSIEDLCQLRPSWAEKSPGSSTLSCSS